MKALLNLASITSLLFFSSCGTFMYKSVSVKTPLFSEKNDFVGQLSMGGAGGEVYAAYAPIKYLGASLSFAGGKFSRDTGATNVYTKKFRDYEWALIPFYSVESFRFEMPLGVGYTSLTNINSGVTTSPYNRSFVQPTVGLHTDNVDFALFCRFTQVAYEFQKFGTDTRYEPGFTLRAGSQNVKLMLQFRLDTGTNNSRNSGLSIYDQLEYFPWHISYGATFNINFENDL